ncbi:MAG: efflux RND transporter periplasmic adaptor subunit [Planctomycetota bacterium]
MSKRKRWVLVLLLVIVGGAITAGVIFSGKERPKVVQTGTISKMAELRSIVSASGTVEAKESVDIQAEIAGVIVDLPVEEGDWVKKDQVLVKIDPTQTETELAAFRAQLAASEADSKGQEVSVATAEANLARDIAQKKSAEADLLQAEARQELAQRQFDRNNGLAQSGVVSQEVVDSAQSELRSAKAQVEAIKARITQHEAQAKATKLMIEQAKAGFEATTQRALAARANMERSEDSLRKTTIYSPLPGLLTHRQVEKGERAVPGNLSSPQATLMTIADMSVLEAHLLVDETDIIRTEIGQLVEVRVDALPDLPIRGEVTEIGNAPIEQQGSNEGKDFLVKVRLEDPPKSLRPGMSCEGEITTAVKHDVLVVPIQALARRDLPVDENGEPLSEPEVETPLPSNGAAAASEPSPSEPDPVVEKKEFEGVYLLEPDLRVRFQVVETGIAGEMELEVLSGLSGGEEIVIGPFKVLRELAPGDLVRKETEAEKAKQGK